MAVAANPGWYIMPDFDVAYPYGLRGAGIDEKQAAQAFGRKLVVLLGEKDNDPGHHQLSRSPEAMLQGNHRFERGHNFFDRARRTAAQLNTPLAWSLRIAPGVAHSNARIAPHAASAMAGN
jgi:hypothetical protein